MNRKVITMTGLGALGLAAALAVAGASPTLRTALRGGSTSGEKTETRHIGQAATGLLIDGQLKGAGASARGGIQSPRVARGVPARIPAAANLADFPVLYGYHNADDTWQTLSRLPGGFFAFHAAEGASLMQLETEADKPMAACYAKGKFYMMYCTREDGVGKLRIEIYDAGTWEHLDSRMVVNETDEWALYLRQVAAYDPAANKIYTSTWGTGKPILSISLDDFSYEAHGEPNKFVQTMFMRDGVLYGITFNEKKLYKIDPSTGEYTEVGVIDLPFNISADPMSACYDPSTDKVYWVVVNGNSKESWLYSLDTATAHAELISRMPSDEHFLGLFVPDAPADAPAAATGISFAGGKLNFTAPAQTYTSGTALTGALTTVVTLDGTPVASTTVSPGESVSIDVDAADGHHRFTVATSNSAGTSPERILNTYVGQDVPAAVTGLTLSNDDNANMTLTWTAPAVSMQGGPVDDAAVNYRITRLPDYVVVADNYKETTFSEPVPYAHARYSYEVVARNGDRDGAAAVSNIITAGDTWIVPYTERFETQADFDSFKVIDANSDSHSWHYIEALQSAYLTGNGTPDINTGIYEGNGNDDYLITPMIDLKAGTDYELRFESGDQWLVDEHMTILVGKSREVSGGETSVFSDNIRPGQHYGIVFTVPEDGRYALMFHADQPGPSVNITLDNISLTLKGSHNGPGAVNDLMAEAGAMGAIVNTLSFTAPTATYGGGTLGTISLIEVYRNGSRLPVMTYANPAPGEKFTWVDNEVSEGSVTYDVVAYNAEGQGATASVTNWVGLDMPAPVGNVRITQNGEFKPVISFDKATAVGAHGGYVVPDDVTYAIFRYNEYNWTDHWEQASEFGTDLTITDSNYSSWGQSWVDYIVVAANEAGQSEGAGIGTTIGEPHPLPWNESFAWGFPAMGPWTVTSPLCFEMSDGSGRPAKPYDQDNGYLVYKFYETWQENISDHHYINGPRVNLSGTELPELSFYMYHGYEAEPEDLFLKVYANYDDEGWTEIGQVPYNNGTTGWGRVSFPMRNEAKDVQISFGGHAADASAEIYVDAIQIAEGNLNDVAVESVSVDRKRVEAGESATVKAVVANYGMKDAADVKVALYRGDEEFMVNAAGTLAQGETRVISFEVPTARADASVSYTYTVKAELDGDSNTGNNVSSPVSIYVKGSINPVPGELAATGGETVRLTWTAPSTNEVADASTDDFEAYENFIIDGIGDWKVYDGDGTSTAYFGGPEIPNCFSPKAWQVWAPEAAGFSIEKFEVLRPHSGTKYLTCWAASDGVSKTLPNDDWLISPEIVGGTDVSFWYRMPNEGSDPQKFEILYSTTDREPESFIAFDSDAITFGTDWRYFEYTLPADARYFAIRSCCEGSYTVALLDDLTCTPLVGSTTELTLEGYNVYRDNELIASNVAETSYDDTTADAGEHVYHVTAAWAEGESNYSNPASAVCLGVDAVTTGVRVYTSEGAIVITGAGGLYAEVVVPAGYRVFGRTAGDTERIAVAPGVYFVKIGTHTWRVIVR